MKSNKKNLRIMLLKKTNKWLYQVIIIIKTNSIGMNERDEFVIN